MRACPPYLCKVDQVIRPRGCEGVQRCQQTVSDPPARNSVTVPGTQRTRARRQEYFLSTHHSDAAS